jgi:hypothetical protein
LNGNAQNPSTIIALKLAGFKTREQQLENFLSVVWVFDLTADFKGQTFGCGYHECGFRGECPMEGIVCGFSG